MFLKPHPIVEPWQVERMRQIFNATLPDLATVPLELRDEFEQQMWWTAQPPGRVRAWLYSPLDIPWRMIAFSTLTTHAGFTTPLFAIDPEHHGKGYGKEIIQHYLQESRGPLAGSALKSNHAIMHLNQRAGWQVLAEDEQVVKLFHPGLAIDAPPIDRQEEIWQSILEYHSAR